LATPCLNPKLLDAPLLVFIKVSLGNNTPDALKEFNAQIKPIPEVLECFMVAGAADYLIKACVTDTAAQQNLLAKIQLVIKDVRQATTYTVIEEVKHTGTIVRQQPWTQLSNQ